MSPLASARLLRTSSARLAALGVGAVLCLALSSGPAWTAGVEVAVTGVTAARGHIRVDLCTKDTFLTSDCPYQGQAPAMVGATVVRIDEVPPGEYAAQVFHDETDEGVVHQNLLGIPREKIGFSNDAPLHLRGPKFREAAFLVSSQLQRITLKVHGPFHLGR